MRENTWVGPAGRSYEDWRGIVYPASKQRGFHEASYLANFFSTIEINETLPVNATFAEHTPETVLEYAVEPAGGVVMQLSMAARRLQHGRVQAYLLYLLIGLAALAVVVLVGVDK
jgi:hypothetical protein